MSEDERVREAAIAIERLMWSPELSEIAQAQVLATAVAGVALNGGGDLAFIAAVTEKAMAAFDAFEAVRDARRDGDAPGRKRNGKR